MSDPDLIGLFIEPLEEAGLSYMITGGVAAVVYGDPRFTRDIDVVLELPVEAIPLLSSAFDPSDYHVPPPEALLEEASRVRGGHFNLIHMDTALRADVYVAGDDPLHTWAFGRRQRLALESGELWVAPVEYVILRKLDYYRAGGSERHLRDIAMMFRISGEMINGVALRGWCARLGLEDALETAKGYSPD